MNTPANQTDYQIHDDQILGEGGMGVVYGGVQISLGRPVAVKIIRSDFTGSPALVERFRREAELLARVVDGNVVQIFGAGEWNSRHFYAMELVPGKDLARRLREGQRFTEEEVLHVAEGVGRALQAAWKFQIVHRDIKPSNILITPDGAVKVADFGLAKSLRGDPNQSMMIAGTSRYLSPEQGLGQPVDIRSDLYSLGVVLYEMATSRLPFEGDAPTALIYQHVHAQPPPPRQVCPSVSEPMEALILRCLSKSAADRYQTPEEFLEAVRAVRRRLRGGDGTTALRAPSGGARAPAGRRRRLGVWAGLAGAAAAAAAWGVWTWREAPAGPSEQDLHRQAVELALGLGDYAGAMSRAETHFGRESPEYQRALARYREGKLREWEGKVAEALKKRNWPLAANAYENMQEFADAKRREELSAGLAFCRDLAAAQKYEQEEAWERALEIYRRRLDSPGEHRAYLEQAVKRVAAEVEDGQKR